ncbi:TPA: helix-hairpin-helix domain-containing protein, partial [Candidatus Poribacteria bacterium]|nr:helix-hairpin-helix domain-containing protein [Candidatus Poribacteria bacterium]
MHAVAQLDKGQGDAALVEAAIEMIAENAEDEEIDYTTLFDDLIFLLNRPINLNNCTKDDLSSLVLLNEIQINNLLAHIEDNGKLITIYELQAIDGFDLKTINNILPFVKVNRDFEALNVNLKEVLKNGKHELFLRSQLILEEQKGFSPIDSADLAANPNSRYLGSKPKFYTRYRFKYGRNISIGFTGEKDAGEEFFNGSQEQGYDYVSAHAFAKDLGVVKRLAIGDYQVQLGQGLTMWSGLAFGKSAQVMNIKKTAQVIKPYTSVDENLFMRGAAATIAIKKLEFTGFYSKKKIDANISVADTSSQEVIEVTSFQQTGFHATPGELEDKNAIDEAVWGGNIAYKSRKFSTSVSVARAVYSANLNRNLQEYSQFDFSSDENYNYGLDYSYVFKNVNLFGEVSRSQNGGMAYINGVIVSLDPRLSVSVFHRHYDRNFQNLFSNAIGESSRNVNENGLYVGATSKINRRWTLSAYYDVFQFPWLRYRTDAPSIGSEWLAQLNYRPSRKVEMYLRARRELKDENATGITEGINYLVDRRRTYIRYHTSFSLNDAVKLKSRVEVSEYVLGENAPEKGFLVYQDVSYKMTALPLALSFRFAMFETDTYNARMYVYETDVLYAFSIPAYYYRGTRMYIMARVKLLKRMDIWLRYAQTYYDD